MQQDAIIDWPADVSADLPRRDTETRAWLHPDPLGRSRAAVAGKRAFDLVASVVLLILCAPLLLLIVIVIRLDSPGRAFFRQTRVGRGDGTFEIFKFRTMTVDAESRKDALRAPCDAGDLFKLPGDPRITRVGRALRRTSLDELPQLVNVVRGEMSLVGPRPLIPAEDRQIEGSRGPRLAMTPGMTGPWQVCGPARPPLSEMVSIDVQYGETWSMWSDVKILLRTVPHVLLRRGM